MKDFIKNFMMILCGISICMISGCSKLDEFLDTKPNQSLGKPESLADLKLLLSREIIFTRDPAVGNISADEYYLTTDVWKNSIYTAIERNAYIWSSEIYDTSVTSLSGWAGCYSQIYVANTVLDALKRIVRSSENSSQFDEVKGMALFYRSNAFYNLVQTFALPYDLATANIDLGIPLRLESDITLKSKRATVQQCYDQVINDLKVAVGMLPLKVDHVVRPSQPAANALLARVYLALGNYEAARESANACLKVSNSLEDFNEIRLEQYNISKDILSEDIYHAVTSNTNATARTLAIIDSNLYELYAENDLRKSVYYYSDGTYIRFKGTYDPLRYLYTGLATDEVYLIRAECNVRLGDSEAALYDLNKLLKHRMDKNSFISVVETDNEKLLRLILSERRKELVFRGLRWTDLRRLNKDERFKVTLTRIIDEITYTLPPNNKRYAFAIPPEEIELSGIEQNQR